MKRTGACQQHLIIIKWISLKYFRLDIVCSSLPWLSEQYITSCQIVQMHTVALNPTMLVPCAQATVPGYFIVNIYLFVYFVIQIFILYYIIQPDISFILSSHCYSGLHQIPLLCGCMYCELHEFLGCFLRSCVISVAAVLSHCCVLFIFFFNIWS